VSKPNISLTTNENLKGNQNDTPENNKNRSRKSLAEDQKNRSRKSLAEEPEKQKQEEFCRRPEKQNSFPEETENSRGFAAHRMPDEGEKYQPKVELLALCRQKKINQKRHKHRRKILTTQECINGRRKRWMHNSSYSMEAKIMLRYTMLQPLMIV
jgi:hypothetical protein